MLDDVDVLVPNRLELVALAGIRAAEGTDELVAAARSLAVPTVVVTLGGDGALLVTDDRVVHVPAVAVDAVDTTGAGDTFSGAFAATLARGVDVPEAVAVAVTAAALSVTGAGAQTAMPGSDEVRRLRARVGDDGPAPPPAGGSGH